MRISAASPTSCYPTVNASMSFPANTQAQIANFNSAAPYTDSWAVRFSYNGNYIGQPIPSGILNTVSPLTQWQECQFMTMDNNNPNQPTGDIVFKMGDPTVFANCGQTSGSTFVDGNLTDAFWFYVPSQNATYLVVQP
ncbi:hypothetical protein BBI01_04445 [Chryseobacterium artocarpi]|uniref:Uncharacterized protein n=2 Tax=Chryseobacterium artocarpi TaxID=1414727 RepID=A0A1B8ZWI9_9FLAO|nr:hypothetical protein BBI01_04445 [Chryseobacterium artocarpi]